MHHGGRRRLRAVLGMVGRACRTPSIRKDGPCATRRSVRKKRATRVACDACDVRRARHARRIGRADGRGHRRAHRAARLATQNDALCVAQCVRGKIERRASHATHAIPAERTARAGLAHQRRAAPSARMRPPRPTHHGASWSHADVPREYRGVRCNWPL